jgi:hypothetical protein
MITHVGDVDEKWSSEIVFDGQQIERGIWRNLMSVTVRRKEWVTT